MAVQRAIKANKTGIHRINQCPVDKSQIACVAGVERGGRGSWEEGEKEGKAEGEWGREGEGRLLLACVAGVKRGRERERGKEGEEGKREVDKLQQPGATVFRAAHTGNSPLSTDKPDAFGFSIELEFRNVVFCKGKPENQDKNPQPNKLNPHDYLVGNSNQGTLVGAVAAVMGFAAFACGKPINSRLSVDSEPEVLVINPNGADELSVFFPAQVKLEPGVPLRPRSHHSARRSAEGDHEYSPEEEGDYRVHVKWSGEHVPGSPFHHQDPPTCEPYSCFSTLDKQ
ncbi:hypothetical protein ACROYT_G009254 [Oculina patagonica]